MSFSFHNALLTVLFAIALAACGGDSDNDSEKDDGNLDGNPYLIVDQGDLKKGVTELTGTGSVVFKNPIGEIGSNKNYQLAFSLEDGESLQLVSHSNNKLEKGVTVKLTRAGAKLDLSLLAANSESSSKTLKGVDASKEVALSVDVHNSESPTHIMVWKAGQSGPDEDNALFNSEADAETPGRGTGGFAGIKSSKAVVKTFKIGDAKFAD